MVIMFACIRTTLCLKKDSEYFQQVLSDFNNFGRDSTQKSGNQKLTYFQIFSSYVTSNSSFLHYLAKQTNMHIKSLDSAAVICFATHQPIAAFFHRRFITLLYDSLNIVINKVQL